MFDPAIYNDEFFAKWGTANQEYVTSARGVAEEIYSQYRPATVLDLGCGAGVHGARLKELGAEVVFADGFPCPDQFRAPGVDVIEQVDLMQAIPISRFDRVDLVLCLDVAEHLPPEHSGTLVANCTRFSDLVVFSAAPPDQGGDGHLNEQPRRYWIDKFTDASFRHCRKEAGWLDKRTLARREDITLRWMATQLAVYRKGLRFPYPFTNVKAIPPHQE